MTSDALPFLEVADRIGARLCRDAVWADGACNWLGWSMEFRGGQWAPAYRAMGSLLYDGTAGIGLFLARLHTLTGDAITGATARGALKQVLSAVEALAASGEYGFYAGLSGIAHACLTAAPLLRDPELAERGRHLLASAAGIAPAPQRLDVVNGSAGVIPILIGAAASLPPMGLLDAAMRHGEHLLAHADRSADGWSWKTLGNTPGRNLVGYSHGTAGIACALLELAQATSRSDFLSAGLEALRYERTHFRPAQGNWPDLRDFGATTGEPPCMCAWCHGAPGIGIGRLRMLDVLPGNPEILADADIAIATTAASLRVPAANGAGNYSLCHGHGGNAELLILATDRLGRPDLRERAEETGRAAAAHFEQQRLPWPCGVPGAGETPNLMLGTAGIGYFYLRLHNSRVVPSILSIGA